MLDVRSAYQDGSFWYYAPNKGASIAFAIFFGASGIMHTFQCIKYRSWRVTGLLPWSALLFVVGFILRAIGAFGLWDNINIFISSIVFLLAAPPVYEGANFFILGRMLYYIPYHSPIHPGRVFTTFVAMGAVIEALTGNGGALVANRENTEAKQNIGKNLIKASLILQILLMVGFASVAGRFHYNCFKGKVLNTKIRRCLIVLYCSCTLITIRTIYRTVEYFTAASLDYTDEHISPILTSEPYFWCFEAVVMISNSVMLNVFHPSSVLPRSNKTYLAPDGVTEVKGPGYKDPRPFLATLIDPFDILGLVTGKSKGEKYWENTPSNGAVVPASAADAAPAPPGAKNQGRSPEDV